MLPSKILIIRKFEEYILSINNQIQGEKNGKACARK